MNNRANDEGFTFIETLVSFAILALALGYAFQSVNLGSRSQLSARSALQMIQIAEEEIAYLNASKTIAEGAARKSVADWEVRTTVRKFTNAGITNASESLFLATVVISGKSRKVSGTWHASLVRVR